MLKYYFLSTILLCNLLFQVHANSIASDIRRKIDRHINNEFLPAAKVSGLGLAIVQNDGEILYTTGYGLADKEKGISNGKSTQFLTGSLTKAMTSVIIVKLLHEHFPDMGEIVLDTPIRELLPQANFTLIDRYRSEDVNFRDLLAHRVCVNSDKFFLTGEPFNTTEEVVFRTRYSKHKCSIRTKSQYNNRMYTIAGELAGMLANKPYSDLLQDFLNDLGMTNSALVMKTDDFSQMPNRAMPYYVMDNEEHRMNSELIKRINVSNASGGLYATPEDMTKYLRFLLNLGNLDGKQIVPRKAMEWLTKPALAVPKYDFKRKEDDKIVSMFGYGLGLVLGSYDGWRYISHVGFFPPYRSTLSIYPEKNLGIFTATNMCPVEMDQALLHSYIFEVMNGNNDAADKVAKLMKQLEEEKEAETENTSSSKQQFKDTIRKQVDELGQTNDDISGRYGNGAEGDVEISKKVNDATGQTEYYLEYGRWFKGWLRDEFLNVIFKINFDTDVIQDDYVDGYKESTFYAAVFNGTLTIFQSIDGNQVDEVNAVFERGVSLNTLPSIPWSPDSCVAQKT